MLCLERGARTALLTWDTLLLQVYPWPAPGQHHNGPQGAVGAGGDGALQLQGRGRHGQERTASSSSTQQQAGGSGSKGKSMTGTAESVAGGCTWGQRCWAA